MRQRHLPARSGRPLPERALIDAKQVIRWVRSHAAEYGAPAATLIVAGSSAGAHLASMAALTASNPAFQPGLEDADTAVTGRQATL